LKEKENQITDLKSQLDRAVAESSSKMPTEEVMAAGAALYRDMLKKRNAQRDTDLAIPPEQDPSFLAGCERSTQQVKERLLSEQEQGSTSGMDDGNLASTGEN
jgi:hypothetical protein